MSVEQQFINTVNAHLELLTNDLKAVLNKLITLNFSTDVKTLVFEVYADKFCDEFPVRLFLIDQNSNRIELDGVDCELLSIVYVYPPEVEDDFISKDDELDPWSISINELVKWFCDCWDEVYTESFNLEATISAHDSHFKYNLIQKKWQD